MYLFVCTGNTCRSPMAETLSRSMGHHALSCGLYAHEGSGASSGAMHAMASRGLDLSSHRAQPVSETLMRQADKVVGISSRHAMALQSLFPQYADKITAMPVDIPDPFSGDDDDYMACAEMIEEALKKLFQTR